ncbi:N-6 DNA methylase [Luteibacter aegosomaticola]|uniref:Eco57I restriction-modification methylase domain-containing protein n=1 Tax=Luteibacter aegosomaticola TaxID=2911538 RepID=UPI001FFAAD4C|nr:TaqI-like C-terminal specificity domain-containing protein [Luteibacter aegosomaticola]UPG89504.1 N-6 DNA methylase [Luteibacter aegosomaticola]
MSDSLGLAFERVVELIDSFQEHINKFLQPNYQEAEVRKDFIDPFFEALGWDVLHRSQRNPWEQEVKVEKTVAFALTQKKADYSFSLAPDFNTVRFYVEAKKPSIDLVNSKDAHFQTVRYGWSAGTPLAVLTDFEQILILDCRRRPNIDSVLDQAIKTYRFSDFRDEERFAEFYWIFSREALATGAFDRYVEALPKAKGGAKQRALFAGAYMSVDESFLAELEEHRETLAKVFKRADPSLNSLTLTEITQKTLDRLVFLRFLEDKLIEPNLRVADLGRRQDAWTDFLEASRQLDATYNGIIFKVHPSLDRRDFPVDADQFGDVCERLSHLNSPYDLNVIPIHILGSIYERFLGKVISATEKRVKVVEKPEIRKAGGVYYTPEHIVAHIVERTLGPLVNGREPKDVWSLKIADIACGSGSFLLGVYGFLLNYLERWYNEGKEDAVLAADRDAKAKNHGCVRDDNGLWRLGLKLRRDILTKCVYGVDIDRQAVEVSQLSLFLKLLENESAGSARQFAMDFGDGKAIKLLPDLSQNVVCGNSLVGWDDLGDSDPGDEDARALNPLDFRDTFSDVMKGGGFSAIVGNPPYEVVEKERGKSSWPHDAFVRVMEGKATYEAAFGGKLNMYRFFLVRFIQLVRANGRIGLIVPMSIMADVSCVRGRLYLLSSLDDLQADCFPQKDNPSKRVFKDAKLSTVVITGQRSSIPTGDARVRVRVFPANRLDDESIDSTVTLADARSFDPKNAPFPMVGEDSIQLARRIYGRAGVGYLKDCEFVSTTRGEINQTTYRKFISSDSRLTRLLKGVEVGRYEIRDRLSQGMREWFDEAEFLETNRKRDVVKKRRIATQRITGVDERLRIVAMICDPPAYFADSTNSIVVDESSGYRAEYVLAILNSRLAQWRFKMTSSNNNVATNELDVLPIRFIDFRVPEERSMHDALVGLAERLIAARSVHRSTQSTLDEEIQARKILSLERQLDDGIYRLFGLGHDDIEIIEGKKKSDD